MGCVAEGCINLTCSFIPQCSCLPETCAGPAPHWRHVWVKERNAYPNHGKLTGAELESIEKAHKAGASVFKQNKGPLAKKKADEESTPATLPGSENKPEVKDAGNTAEAKPSASNNETVRHYVEDVATGNLYLWEHGNDFASIGTKAVLISIFSPLYALAVAVTRLVLSVISLVKGEFAEAGHHFLMALASPYYWARLEIGALSAGFVAGALGILGGITGATCLKTAAVAAILDGRKMVAEAHRDWFDGRDWTYDPRYRPTNAADAHDSTERVCFLAWCFLPRFNIREQSEDIPQFDAGDGKITSWGNLRFHTVRTQDIC
jgi:hypothetical protein